MQNEKNISFIEQLTNKQIEDFLDKLYPKNEGFDISFDFKSTPSEKYWVAKIFRFGWESPLFIRLEEYNSSISDSSKWIQYLNQTFGDAYKKAYSDNCLSLLDED